MPEFANPFSGTVPERKLTREELIRAIRLNIAAEHEAVHLYTAHADATDDVLAKKVLIDVANEERVHIGEFMRLLEILTGDEANWLADGRAEVDEIASGSDAPIYTSDSGRSVGEASSDGDAGRSMSRPKPTVGSLKDS